MSDQWKVKSTEKRPGGIFFDILFALIDEYLHLQFFCLQTFENIAPVKSKR